MISNSWEISLEIGGLGRQNGLPKKFWRLVQIRRNFLIGKRVPMGGEDFLGFEKFPNGVAKWGKG